MKDLLLRLWQWLGRLLGVEPAAPPLPPAEPGLPAEPDVPVQLPPPVTLPPLRPQDNAPGTEHLPRFSAWASVLTKREHVFYTSLRPAAANRFAVLCKVRLWDIIHLDNEPVDRKEHNTRMSCRHIDFLLCDRDTLQPRLAIELDDNSHKNDYAIADDRYKNELFAAAGLPLLRLARPNYTSRELRAMIDEAVNP